MHSYTFLRDLEEQKGEEGRGFKVIIWGSKPERG